MDIAAARSAATTTPASAGGRAAETTCVSTAPFSTSGYAVVPIAPIRAAKKLTPMTSTPAWMHPDRATDALFADW